MRSGGSGMIARCVVSATVVMFSSRSTTRSLIQARPSDRPPTATATPTSGQPLAGSGSSPSAFAPEATKDDTANAATAVGTGPLTSAVSAGNAKIR